MKDYFFVDKDICLCPLHKEDKAVFLKWHNDSKIRNSIGGLIPFSEAEFLEACEMRERINPSSLWFSICDCGQIVGIVGIHQIKYIQRNAELSILIGEEENRKKGIATRIIKMIERYVFRDLQMHRLYANIFSDNKPSIRLVEKCGWEREGLLKDAAFWDGQYKNVIIFSKINLLNMNDVP